MRAAVATMGGESLKRRLNRNYRELSEWCDDRCNALEKAALVGAVLHHHFPPRYYSQSKHRLMTTGSTPLNQSDAHWGVTTTTP